MKWVDLRDSTNRIHASETTTGRYFILNTNRITDIKEITGGGVTKSSFQYSENPNDRREGVSYLETDHTVAQLIAHFDDTPASQAVTLSIVPYNNPWGTPCFPIRPTVDTTIGIWSIAYIDRYNPDPNKYVWVCYYKGAFKRMEVLCLIDTGSPILTSTSTTTEAEQ